MYQNVSKYKWKGNRTLSKKIEQPDWNPQEERGQREQENLKNLQKSTKPEEE